MSIDTELTDSEVDRRLFFRALCEDKTGTIIGMSGTDFAEKHSWWLWDSLLVLIGLAAMTFSVFYLSSVQLQVAEVVRAFGDAAVIAGFLALVVDRPLKRRLLAEAARGIFKHMLGFEQQPQIRDRLEKIALQTKLFTRNRHIQVKIEPAEMGSVTVTVRTEVDLVNPSPTVIPWEQYMAFERAERATALGMGLLCSDSRQNYWCDEPLKPLNGGGVLEARAPRIEVSPGLEYRLIHQHKQLAPDDFYVRYHVALPSIGFEVSVECPEEFEVEVGPYTGRAKMAWKYDGLLMTGEYVNVRWCRKVDAAVAASPTA